MMNLTPAQMLAYTTSMAEQLAKMKKRAVFVGLPAENVGGKVYGDGMTILQIGAIHEYGALQQGIPERSFLRVPFRTKANEINKGIAKQFERVASGKIDTEKGLGLIGALAVNISKGAFTSLGYGMWKPDTAETIRRKGSSQTLIDTGVLRSSISAVVRDAT